MCSSVLGILNVTNSKNPFGSAVTKGNPAVSSLPSSLPAVVENPDALSLLDFLPKQTVANLPQGKREALIRSLDDGGFFALNPMLCQGDKCPIYEKCPLQLQGVPLPFGSDCPVETASMMMQHKLLINSMPTEDLSDPFTMMLVQDLELVNLILSRASAQFAVDGGKVEKKYVVGYGPSGQPLYTTDVHKTLPIIEKYGKRKREIMAKLLTTPQDKARAEREGLHDKSRQSAMLQRKIEEILEKREGLKGPPILDAQFEVKK
jgi:hypothetical protein